MRDVFSCVLSVSLKASCAVLAVILLRFVLKDAPKRTRGPLWAVVGVRLALSFSLESELSLIPRREALENMVIIGPITEILPAQGDFVARNGSEVLAVFGMIWAVGAAALLLYAAVSYYLMYRRVAVSLCVEENIYLCDDIDKPFILGVFRPRICLPSGMGAEQAALVIRHEQAHLERWDHIWKPLSFVLAALHWFNPVVWLGYKLFGQDIELACDEKTINRMDIEERKVYTETLLACGMGRRMRMACPVAFGEVSVQERVVSVLSYRRTAQWRTTMATTLCVLLAVCFLTDPMPKGSVVEAVAEVTVEEVEPKRFPDAWRMEAEAGSGVSFHANGIALDGLKCCPYVKNVGMEISYMFQEESTRYETCDGFWASHEHQYGLVYSVARCKNCGSEIGAYYVGRGMYCEYKDKVYDSES